MVHEPAFNNRPFKRNNYSIISYKHGACLFKVLQALCLVFKSGGCSCEHIGSYKRSEPATVQPKWMVTLPALQHGMGQGRAGQGEEDKIQGFALKDV